MKIVLLVHHIDLSWNTLEPSLVLMYEKLTDLGRACYNGEVCVVEPETIKISFQSDRER